MGKTFFVFCFLSFGVYTYAQQAPTVTAAASQQYSDPSFFKRLMLGSNYREEWETPVQLPVFRLKQMGFSIKELGGGMQTKSLQLKDKQGRSWALRSVEKDVSPNLPNFLQGTLAERIVQDMISAAHPYAPLTIPPMANALGIIVPSPVFYFIPDDPDLGEYRSLFANTICMLEQREPTYDNSETENTVNALEDLIEKNTNLVLQKQVLKARLLDMLIADWDRHADQWRWGQKDSAGFKWHYAIPRDRDQAYFYSNGLLVKLARKVALRHLVNFRYNLAKIKQLNFKSWEFDQTFINDLDRNDWTEIIQEVQNKLTDAVIDDAVKKLPPEIYPISGAVITAKLKNRRNQLMEEALEYYDFISNTVTFTGTDDTETFRIKKSGEKMVVEVLATRSGRLLHQRAINSDDTRRIELVGLGSSDHFLVEEDISRKIKISIQGGTGSDVYDLGGNKKITVSDFKAETNEFKNSNGAKIKLL